MQEHTKKLEGFRCEKCHKLLAVHAGKGSYEIKCGRCGNLNMLLQEMMDQVIVTDPTGKILYVNEQLQKITGYSAEEAVGQKPSLWGGQMSQDFYKKLWHKISVDKQGVEVGVVNKTKQGKLYQAFLQISPVVDAHGEVMLYVGIERVIHADKNTTKSDKGSVD